MKTRIGYLVPMPVVPYDSATCAGKRLQKRISSFASIAGMHLKIHEDLVDLTEKYQKEQGILLFQKIEKN